MKVFLVLGLAFAAMLSFNNQAARATQQDEKTDVKRKAEALQISLIMPKLRYKQTEKIKLHVMLNNVSDKNLYVLGTLEWGYNASLLLHVRDASGKEIEPTGFPDDQTLIDLEDQSAFLKLRPNHFLGTNFVSTLKFLNMNKPGKYSLYVEYFSKVPNGDVKVTPFWGYENGTIFSNLVCIEIVR
jgi:hypothetical protein